MREFIICAAIESFSFWVVRICNTIAKSLLSITMIRFQGEAKGERKIWKMSGQENEIVWILKAN
ncbi:hypothetical protein QQP08_016955 [Theobroma cacao]|nr:hypothetical protein QQP08_016955 [Theobroma cacao]